MFSPEWPIEVELDFDFVRSYEIEQVICVQDIGDGTPDFVVIQTYGAIQASLAYNPRLEMPEHPELI